MAELHVLLVEDDPVDAELVVRELAKSGYEPVWTRVDTSADYLRRLEEAPPDIVISDHAMPQFSSAEALRHLQASGRTLPFIIVSHAIGEEEAVQMIRSGASDYVMKDRLGRLGEAVRAALAQYRLRHAHAEAQRTVVALNADLERRIEERTAELQASNRALASELASRKRAEQALRESEDRLRTLAAQLEHLVDERTRELVQSRDRLRDLATELNLIEQRERRRLATDLHDHLAQLLVLCRLKLAQAKRGTSAGPAPVDSLKQADEVLGEALAYTRTLVADLAPPVLHDLGLQAALHWLRDYMRRFDLEVAVHGIEENRRLQLPDEEGILLFQSVRELLMNCRKYADVKEAVIAVQSSNERLRITVQDKGKGFEPLTAITQSHASLTKFGLFSIRERMNALGGSFEIESAPGKGTTATLTLPLDSRSESGSKFEVPGSKLSSSNLEPRTPNFERHQPSARIRVLLVDDHAMVRQGLRSVLETYPEMEIVGEAANGEQAVEAAAACRPDVVVMDINMPKMNGVDATARIKAGRPDSVIIGLSVNAGGENHAAMLKAGAVRLLTKEAAVEQLHSAIREALTRS